MCPGLTKPTTVIWRLCHPGARLSVSCLAFQGHKMTVLFWIRCPHSRSEGREGTRRNKVFLLLRCLPFYYPRARLQPTLVHSLWLLSNYHTGRGVSTQQIFIVTILEARSLKSGGAMFPPERRNCPCLFQLLVAAGIPWLVAASVQSTSPRSHCLLSVCLPLLLSHKDM